jgi:hypothetical protein
MRGEIWSQLLPFAWEQNCVHWNLRLVYTRPAFAQIPGSMLWLWCHLWPFILWLFAFGFSAESSLIYFALWPFISDHLSWGVHTHTLDPGSSTNLSNPASLLYMEIRQLSIQKFYKNLMWENENSFWFLFLWLIWGVKFPHIYPISISFFMSKHNSFSIFNCFFYVSEALYQKL